MRRTVSALGNMHTPAQKRAGVGVGVGVGETHGRRGPGLGSDGATLKSNGSHLFACSSAARHQREPQPELVVRRLEHTLQPTQYPWLPYVFSEATENKEVRHLLGARQEARTVKSPNGKVIELFMPFSSSSFPRTRPSSTCRFSSQLLNRFSLWDL